MPRPVPARLAVWVSAAILGLCLSGCAVDRPTAGVVMTELFFGMSKVEGGRAVDISESDWQRFVEEHIVAAFPDGFTVVDALGQYRSAAAGMVRERSKIVMIVHRPAPPSASAIDHLVAEYKRRFAQEEVLRISIPLVPR